jgi:ElaB/YqjD/DUF883 family membrane-anchored ribosome-binding protein
MRTRTGVPAVKDRIMADSPAAKPRKPRAASTAKATAAPRKRKATPNTAERVAADAANSSAQEKLRAKAEGIRAEATRKAGEIGDEVSKLAGQAGDRARNLANQGKDKAAHGLEALAKAIEDSAGTVDDRLGQQYGDFARSAAGTVAGLAGKLDQQDIDELVASTRDFVKKSPAVAIGSAAVVGFMLARLLRSSDKS